MKTHYINDTYITIINRYGDEYDKQVMYLNPTSVTVNWGQGAGYASFDLTTGALCGHNGNTIFAVKKCDLEQMRDLAAESIGAKLKNIRWIGDKWKV